MIENFLRKRTSDSFRLKIVSRYLRAGLVVMMDIITALIASVCALLLVGLILPKFSLSATLIVEWLAFSFLGAAAMQVIAKPYRAIIRYATIRELYPTCLAAVGKAVIMLALLRLISSNEHSFAMHSGLVVVDMLLTTVLSIATRLLMVIVYNIISRSNDAKDESQNVLVYGVGNESVAMVARLQNSPHYNICGFITDDKNLQGHKIAGLSVFSFSDLDSVAMLLAESNADGILFACATDARNERERLMNYCNELDSKTFIVPAIDVVQDGKILDKTIRKIKIEDLLGRPEIQLSMDQIEANFKGKTILVTGAAGSIGSELCRQLATFGIKELVMFDNAETPLHNVRMEFENEYPNLKFTPVIGDVRQLARLDFVFRKFHPQVVFHAAAYKHVPLMEENPCEAVLVNVVGSRQVADKCLEYDVEKMVMISTDKAVNPTNIMGCTKRLAEIYVQSLGLAVEQGRVNGKTKFITTRFGNVLGSNGSVIPHFNAQIAAGGPITVTHPEIVRYFMSIPEACRLVMEAATISSGNQICVFDMGKPVKIVSLAEQMVRLAGLKLGEDIEIKFTGLRPGEKLYEEVLATKENTIPTKHESIFIAKVRAYDYDEAAAIADELETLSRAVDIPTMVKLMKKTVPEFKSKNSPYEIYDLQPVEAEVNA
jgi:FlaA1/EpsC-like NDP-sugar epimerase